MLKPLKIYNCKHALLKEFYVSVRADKRKKHRFTLHFLILFYKRDGNLCLVNISNNEIWLDSDSGKPVLNN